MKNRLAKRHKRQVARAKMKNKVSEPDVRTPEQIQAAREASRPVGGWGATSVTGHSSSGQSNKSAVQPSAAKSDG